MKYYVFSAAEKVDKNKPSIEAAKKAKETLENYWDMNACTTGIYEGSTLIEGTDTGNYFIYAEDEDIYRLIYTCMQFAREHTLKLHL